MQASRLINTNLKENENEEVTDYHYMTHLVKPIRLSPKDISELKLAAINFNSPDKKPWERKPEAKKTGLVESNVTFFDHLL